MSLNKVMLIGNLGRDPEVRYMPNGDAVANFSIATNESWTDRNTGNRVDRTEWHNITMYRRQAEIAGQYLRKGSQVYVEGKIQSRKYTDKMGVERTAYEIVADQMRMLGSRGDNGNTAAFDETMGGRASVGGGYGFGGGQQNSQPKAYERNGNTGYGFDNGTAMGNNPSPASPQQAAYAQANAVPQPPMAGEANMVKNPVTPVEDIDDDIPF